MEEILTVCSGIYLHCSSVLRVGEKQRRVVRIGQRISAPTVLQLKNQKNKGIKSRCMKTVQLVVVRG